MAISSNKDRKIDQNWNEIFNKLKIKEKIKSERLFYITSKEINNFVYEQGSRVDARNMTKFDYVKSLPDVFRNNNLSILPVSRGKYVIGKFDAYTKINDGLKEFRNSRKEVPFPQWIESLDYKVITSESAILNVANISGMLKNIFKVEHLEETVTGRMSSKGFQFYVNDVEENKKHMIDVTNSQIEVDAGFETEDSLILVEAKNNITDSFITRQLYYPYRLWTNKIEKKVIPVFLQYRDGLFNFSVYSFEDDNEYSSIKLEARYNFIVAEEEITTSEIVELIKSPEYIEEPSDVPFPQADSLQRIFETMMTLYSSGEDYLTIEEITIINGFTYRQADYYINAGRYLGFLNKERRTKNTSSGVYLSDKGIELMDKSNKERKLGLVRAIMSHKPFNDVAIERLEKGRHISGPEAYELLKNKSYYLPEMTDVTRNRRASTVSSWVKEVLEFSNEY